MSELNGVKQPNRLRVQVTLTPFEVKQLKRVADKMGKPLATVAADLAGMGLRGELVHKDTGKTYEEAKRWEK